MPVLQIAKTRGQIEVADAQLEQSKAKLSDQIQQVNQDIRDSLLDIQSAAKLVEATHSNVDLANEALSEAQQRFHAGVSDNLPVSQAQSQTEQANDQYISALYQHNVAKLALGPCAGRGADKLQRLSRRKVTWQTQAEHPDTTTTATTTAVQEEAPAKKSGRKFIVIAVDRLLLVIGAGLFYWRSTFTESTDDAQVDGDLYQVSSRVTGQVIKVYVEDNQKVKAGDPHRRDRPEGLPGRGRAGPGQPGQRPGVGHSGRLSTCRLPASTSSTSVDTTGSDVQGSTAAVARRSKQEQAAQARVDQAKANAVKSQLDVDRYTPLVQKDVISKQQFDAAVAQRRRQPGRRARGRSQRHRQPGAGHRGHPEALPVALSGGCSPSRTAPSRSSAQQAKAKPPLADVKQAQAKVDQAMLNLCYTHVTAPDGRHRQQEERPGRRQPAASARTS